MKSEWIWGVATATQFGFGVRSLTKGYSGDNRFMPLKAFAVASLFLGSAASASVLILKYNGIHKVEDLVEAGANLRAKLGIRQRTQNKSCMK
ncbi:PREDICTED: uncharacterized protein LOC109359253 isoform X2 [Lupinus angustifolius]|uniref:uncharacterized protein LOC109359253 isoform X2 n=1 Tax=Lupinus angustifolius TaxID=3871 RepID=UPI00092E6CD3|nr:PREDICTED: uncharacterized protein LOC109359253 isoform X2 [Lupinus angustifolius]